LDAYAVKTANRPSALNCGPYAFSSACSPVADSVTRSVLGPGSATADDGVAVNAAMAAATTATDIPRMALSTIPPVFPV